MESKPILHVEALIQSARGGFTRTDTIRREIAEWLETHFVHLTVGQEIHEHEHLGHGSVVECIRIADFSGYENDANIYRVDEVQLRVCTFVLQDDHVATRRSKRASSSSTEEPDAALRSLVLPTKDLVGSWEALIFDNNIPNRLLRLVSGMVEITRCPDLDKTKVNWNKLILLHGPPGCGKTSLCRALAQKLTIRLSQYFTRGKLIELSTHALLSKWFGESGKLVSKIFDEIVSIALEEDETNLVCVLIDEVETLTSKRGSHGEVGDALRATNQLLTALDKLRHRPNVIVLCTSNLIHVIDPAFLDRADVKQEIPSPSASAAFQILRSTMNELLRVGVIVARPKDGGDSVNGTGSGAGDATTEDISMYHRDEDLVVLPSLAETRIRFHGQVDSAPQRLWAVAQKCARMSGRALRRLPLQALAMHAYSTPYSLNDALEALRLAVKDIVEEH